MIKNLMKLSGAAFGLFVGMVIMAPVSHADSQSCGTAGCTTTAIPVNFSITIPTVLRLTIGTAGTTPSVTFDGTVVTSANVASGTAVSPSAVTNSGTATPGAVAYSLLSNISNSNATVTATGVGAGLQVGGVGAAIPYTDIGAVAAGVVGAAVALPVPGTPTVVSPSSGLITRTGTWSYTYANTTIYPAGTYTGAINYTATQP